MTERSGTERKQHRDPWNELRAALIQAQAQLAQLDAAPERRENWTPLLDGALEAVDRFKARQKEIPGLRRAAERLAVEECRDARMAFGRALRESLDQLRTLTKFRGEMRRHALALESSGGEKNGFAAALLRVSRSLEAAPMEDADKALNKLLGENSVQIARYLGTRIKTGGRTFTRDEMNER